MKCNQCGQENVAGAKFCSACGNAIVQENIPQNPTPVTTPMPNTTAPITSGFNNLNAPAQAKKNPAHIIMIIECIVGVVFLVAVASLIIWLVVSSHSGKTEAMRCHKDGEALSQSMAITYNNNKLSKYEITYIIDHTVDENKLTSSERNDLMSASFITLGLAELEGSKGINYRVSESSTITTVSFVADISEMDKSEAAELTEDFDGKTSDDIKSEYQKAGFTCEKK